MWDSEIFFRLPSASRISLRRSLFILALLLCCLLFLTTSGRAEFSFRRNNLSSENSPYLEQHRSNPVWWQPWKNEVFEYAKRTRKLVFLSIGYSTCHWCHVMEAESFEDKEVAQFLNEHFVSVKVDREERPDIDQMYMKAVQALTGRGGWPMTLVLTSEQVPILGDAYIPKPRLLQLLKTVQGVWKENPSRVYETRDRILAVLQQTPNAKEAKLTFKLFEAFQREARRAFDRVYGGFGSAPKFPPSTRLRVLLRSKQREAETMVRTTLAQMAFGALFDQVGGGFHRYTTDRKWRVPHFEKMLYDNAQLSLLYLEAYQRYRDPFYSDVARMTLDYVLREMTAPTGGFFSAQDADSEGREGRYYLWSEDEIRDLHPELLKRFGGNIEFSKEGNFGRRENVIAFSSRQSWEWFQYEKGGVFRKLLAKEREKRKKPFRDDKILTSWNGLMIEAMAAAYRVLGEERYLRAAQRAARFVKQQLWRDGELLRRFRKDESRFDAVLDDYAYLIAALLELHQADGDAEWIEWAVALQAEQDSQFWDERSQVYFSVGSELIVRSREYSDGVRPSAVGVTGRNLLNLYGLTLDRVYRNRADALFRKSSGVIAEAPFQYPSLLLALDTKLKGLKEIVLVESESDHSGTAKLREVLRDGFYPNTVFTAIPDGEIGLPVTARKRALNGKSTVYVCQGSVCKLPTNRPVLLRKQLQE